MSVCNVGKLGLQLLLMPIIAHLLGPRVYGLYSLATPSVVLILMLADAGLGQSLAREPEENEEVWSSAFWLLLGLGALLALVLVAWAFPLAALAHQPKLPVVMVPLSATAIFLTLAVVPSARLTRRARIETYAIVDLVATVIAAAAAVAAALAGLGVWSLVIQMLTLYGMRALALNVIAFRLPSLVFHWRAVAPHTIIGGGIVAVKLSDSLGRMLEVSFISRRFNSAAVGAYGFAGQASWSLAQAVCNPVWSALYVQAIRPGVAPQSIEASYNRLFRTAVMIVAPITFFITAAAGVLVHQFLGPSWSGSVLLLAVVFPTQAMAACAQLAGAAIYASGRSRPQTITSVLNAVMRCTAAFAPFWNWPGVAFALGCANLGYVFLGLMNARLSLGWKLSTTLDALRGPLIAAVGCGVAARLVLTRAPTPPGMATLLASAAAGGAVFLVVLCLIDWPKLRTDIGFVRQMMRGGSALAAVKR